MSKIIFSLFFLSCVSFTQGYAMDVFDFKHKKGNLVNFQTETFLRKFDDFSDELVDKVMHEMTHVDRGSGVRQLIKESPDDIQNVMKKVLEEPNNAKTFLRETDNIRWKNGATVSFLNIIQVWVKSLKPKQ